MKREILCQPCGSAITLRAYSGEGWKKVFGTLNPVNPVNRVMRCDSCNARILSGEPAVALSIYLEGDYQPWESEYLKPQAFQTNPTGAAEGARRRPGGKRAGPEDSLNR